MIEVIPRSNCMGTVKFLLFDNRSEMSQNKARILKIQNSFVAWNKCPGSTPIAQQNYKKKS